MPSYIGGTTGVAPAQWTTAGRPSSPLAGQLGWNTTLGQLEAWNGSVWSSILVTTSTFSGTGPAFSAYLASNQSVSALTFTKIQCGTKEFDTNSNYDNTTNYRFTPTVAGYYQVNIALLAGGTINAQQTNVYIYKNGGQFKQGSIVITSGTGNLASVVSALVFCNGSTDYLEAYGYMNGSGTTSFAGGALNTYFQAFLARSA